MAETRAIEDGKIEMEWLYDPRYEENGSGAAYEARIYWDAGAFRSPAAYRIRIGGGVKPGFGAESEGLQGERVGLVKGALSLLSDMVGKPCISVGAQSAGRTDGNGLRGA